MTTPSNTASNKNVTVTNLHLSLDVQPVSSNILKVLNSFEYLSTFKTTSDKNELECIPTQFTLKGPENAQINQLSIDNVLYIENGLAIEGKSSLAENQVQLYNVPKSGKMTIESTQDVEENFELEGIYIENNILVIQGPIDAITFFFEDLNTLTPQTLSFKAPKEQYPVIVCQNEHQLNNGEPIYFVFSENNQINSLCHFALVAGKLKNSTSELKLNHDKTAQIYLWESERENNEIVLDAQRVLFDYGTKLKDIINTFDLKLDASILNIVPISKLSKIALLGHSISHLLTLEKSDFESQLEFEIRSSTLLLNLCLNTLKINQSKDYINCMNGLIEVMAYLLYSESNPIAGAAFKQKQQAYLDELESYRLPEFYKKSTAKNTLIWFNTMVKVGRKNFIEGITGYLNEVHSNLREAPFKLANELELILSYIERASSIDLKTDRDNWAQDSVEKLEVSHAFHTFPWQQGKKQAFTLTQVDIDNLCLTFSHINTPNQASIDVDSLRGPALKLSLFSLKLILDSQMSYQKAMVNNGEIYYKSGENNVLKLKKQDINPMLANAWKDILTSQLKPKDKLALLRMPTSKEIYEFTGSIFKNDTTRDNILKIFYVELATYCINEITSQLNEQIEALTDDFSVENQQRFEFIKFLFEYIKLIEYPDINEDFKTSDERFEIVQSLFDKHKNLSILSFALYVMPSRTLKEELVTHYENTFLDVLYSSDTINELNTDIIDLCSQRIPQLLKGKLSVNLLVQFNSNITLTNKQNYRIFLNCIQNQKIGREILDAINSFSKNESLAIRLFKLLMKPEYSNPQNWDLFKWFTKYKVLPQDRKYAAAFNLFDKPSLGDIPELNPLGIRFYDHCDKSEKNTQKAFFESQLNFIKTHPYASKEELLCGIIANGFGLIENRLTDFMSEVRSRLHLDSTPSKSYFIDFDSDMGLFILENIIQIRVLSDCHLTDDFDDILFSFLYSSPNLNNIKMLHKSEQQTVIAKLYTSSNFKVPQVTIDIDLSDKAYTKTECCFTVNYDVEPTQPLILYRGKKGLEIISIERNDLLLKAEIEYIIKRNNIIILNPGKSDTYRIKTRIATTEYGVKEYFGNRLDTSVLTSQNTQASDTYFPEGIDISSIYNVTITTNALTHSDVVSNVPASSNKILTDNNKAIHRFEINHPISLSDFTFAAGNFEHFDYILKNADGLSTPVRLVLSKKHAHLNHKVWEHFERKMQFFVDKFNIQYPILPLQIVGIYKNQIGLRDYPGLTYFNTNPFINTDSIYATSYENTETGLLGQPVFTRKDLFDEGIERSLASALLIYEKSHHYLKDQMRFEESFQEFFCASYSYGLSSTDATNRLSLRTSSYSRSKDSFSSTKIYRNGTQIWLSLINAIGIDNFSAGFSLYRDKFPQKGKLENLIQSIEETSNISLSKYLLWFTEAGFPELEATSEYNAITKEFKINIKQIKSESARSASEPFMIPFGIQLLSSNGDLLNSDLSAENVTLSHIKVANSDHYFLDEQAGTITFKDMNSSPNFIIHSALAQVIQAPLPPELNYSVFYKSQSPVVKMNAFYSLLLSNREALLNEYNNINYPKQKSEYDVDKAKTNLNLSMLAISDLLKDTSSPMAFKYILIDSIPSIMESSRLSGGYETNGIYINFAFLAIMAKTLKIDIMDECYKIYALLSNESHSISNDTESLYNDYLSTLFSVLHMCSKKIGDSKNESVYPFKSAFDQSLHLDISNRLRNLARHVLSGQYSTKVKKSVVDYILLEENEFYLNDWPVIESLYAALVKENNKDGIIQLFDTIRSSKNLKDVYPLILKHPDFDPSDENHLFAFWNKDYVGNPFWYKKSVNHNMVLAEELLRVNEFNPDLAEIMSSFFQINEKNASPSRSNRIFLRKIMASEKFPASIKDSIRKALKPSDELLDFGWLTFQWEMLDTGAWINGFYKIKRTEITTSPGKTGVPMYQDDYFLNEDWTKSISDLIDDLETLNVIADNIQGNDNYFIRDNLLRMIRENPISFSRLFRLNLKTEPEILVQYIMDFKVDDPNYKLKPIKEFDESITEDMLPKAFTRYLEVTEANSLHNRFDYKIFNEGAKNKDTNTLSPPSKAEILSSSTKLVSAEGKVSATQSSLNSQPVVAASVVYNTYLTHYQSTVVLHKPHGHKKELNVEDTTEEERRYGIRL